MILSFTRDVSLMCLIDNMGYIIITFPRVFMRRIHVWNFVLLSASVRNTSAHVVRDPSGSIIVRLENVGWCDHSYVYYISNILPDEARVNADDTKKIIFFLKEDMDNSSIHKAGFWRYFEDMIKLSYVNWFACRMKPVPTRILYKRLLLSPFHETQMLRFFFMQEYARNNHKYRNMSSEVVPFQSQHKNIGE